MIVKEKKHCHLGVTSEVLVHATMQIQIALVQNVGGKYVRTTYCKGRKVCHELRKYILRAQCWRQVNWERVDTESQGTIEVVL